jgi:hypothetical protein
MEEGGAVLHGSALLVCRRNLPATRVHHHRCMSPVVDPTHRPGVRRLLGMPAEQVDDCRLRLRATVAGRCAVCSGLYAAQDWIGYSRDADGWVGSCCSGPARDLSAVPS